MIVVSRGLRPPRKQFSECTPDGTVALATLAQISATIRRAAALRWYAFHRQFEIDFNAWRETIGLSPIESVEWCPDMLLTEGQGGAGLLAGVHPAGCEYRSQQTG